MAIVLTWLNYVLAGLLLSLILEDVAHLAWFSVLLQFYCSVLLSFLFSVLAYSPPTCFIPSDPPF